MAEVHPISHEKFAKKYWIKKDDYTFSRKLTTVQIVAAELNKALLNYPIAFAQHENVFMPVVILSLIPGQNLFVGNNGKWLSGYIPAAIRANPFKVAYSKENQMYICADLESEIITENVNDTPFYDKNGNISKELEDVKNFLTEYEKNRLVTLKACETIKDKNLFETWNLKLNFNDKEQKIEGLYKVNEKMMNELPDKSFIELKNAGALPIIYAHLYSMGQISVLKRLLEMRFNKKGNNKSATQAEKVKDDGGELDLDWDKVLKNLK